MDQQKIGLFLKTLRKEKEMTQEEIAEVFNVSRRTVTRWETGVNMPDLDILVEIADYYEVDLKEIFDGERKSEKMNEEMKETAIRMAEYSNDQKDKNGQSYTHLFHTRHHCPNYQSRNAVL